MKPIGIKRGKILCKFCNKPKSHATTNCNCQKNTKWNSPRFLRRTLRLECAQKRIQAQQQHILDETQTY